MATVALNPSFSPDRLAYSAGTAPAFCLTRIFSHAILIIAFLLVNKFGFGGNAVFFGAIAMLAFRGREWPLKAMSLVVLGLVCNQWYVPKSPIWTVARFCLPPLVLLVSLPEMGRLRVNLVRQSYYIWHVLFIAVSALLSIMTGYLVHIALLKLVNYTIATTALFAQVAIQRTRRCDMSEWFMTLIVVVALLGFASLPLGIAYNTRELMPNAPLLYFNGPFYHSNTLGPFAALMSIYLSCVFLFGRYRNRWLCIALIGSLVYFMRLSQSRTSFAALVCGMAVIVLLTFIIRRRGTQLLRLNVKRGSLITGAVITALALVTVDLVTAGRLSKAATAFINKNQQLESIDIDQVLFSRMGRIEQSWANFLQSPLIGIGFELSTDQWFRENASIFYAPIEKGFLPTAVLEQSGIIGTVFFVGSLIAMIGYLARTMNVPGLVMFIAFLIVNCGEVMYFGLAGHGAFGWLFVAAGILLGDFATYDGRRFFRPNESFSPSNTVDHPAQ